MAMRWDIVIVDAIQGLLKGLVLAPCPLPPSMLVKSWILAPITEELVFRKLPIDLARQRGIELQPWTTALPFGLAHAGPVRSVPWSLFRVADATLGGYLYHLAYRDGGYLNAVIAHATHNFACDVGAVVAGKAVVAGSVIARAPGRQRVPVIQASPGAGFSGSARMFRQLSNQIGAHP